MSGLDASAALLAVAHERVPAADLREGDLEPPPFQDDAFDAVTAFNAVPSGDQLAFDLQPDQYENSAMRPSLTQGRRSSASVHRPTSRASSVPQRAS